MNNENNFRLSVLVIEDDEDMMYIISRVLSRCNCEVVGAENGEKAFDILSSTPIDVVFSDMKLPGQYGGEEILEEVCKSYPNIKIVMMSVSMVANRRRELLEKGADECLEKPFFNDVCIDVLANLDNRYQQAA